MPLIDYKCDKCGNSFFEIVSGNEQVKCPKCGSEEVKREYKGKFYGKNGGSCGGNCGGCAGCGH